jgi:hypothetical protein
MCGSFRFARKVRFLRKLGSVICAALFLAACSSGGNDGGGGTPAAATPITGTFVDSPVNGLHYTSPPSNPAGGVTANGGQYHCMTGDTVTFDLGGRTIGSGQPCGPLVTVVSVFGATSTADPRVVNLSRLLLTLGGIPTGQNPIQLPATIPAGLPTPLDFAAPNFTTVLQAGIPDATPVTEAQAIAHLQASFTTLTVTGVDSGTVTSNPPGLTCTEGDCAYDFVTGTAVTLAAAGTGFTGWTGGGCTGVGTCSVLLDAIKAVKALFVAAPPGGSLVPNFKFIGAPGQPLLAINPRSPESSTPVKVGDSDVIFPVGSRDFGSTIASGTYNQGTKSFEHLVANTILFPFQGKLYRASTKLSDGVPGNGRNKPVQVSNYSTTTICGAGSSLDPTNTNPFVGFMDAGADQKCEDDKDNFLVLTHLNEDSNVTPTVLTPGTFIEGDATVYDLTTGKLDHMIAVNANGDLQWMGNNIVLADIIGGTGIGPVTVVARQPGKVFLANAKNLYLYDPTNHILNTTPVVTTNPSSQTLILNQDNAVKIPADGTALYPVQTDGKVFRVPLTTTPGTTITTPHFMAGTAVADVDQTPNRVILLTGTLPYGNSGPNLCVLNNNCNNGILAVSKSLANNFVLIEQAATANQISSLLPFNNYVLYNLYNPSPPFLVGAFARHENAGPNERIARQNNWTSGILNDTFNVVSNQRIVVRAVLVDASPAPCTQQGCVIDGTPVRAFDQPTTPLSSARLLGTVSDQSNTLQNSPFFRSSINAAMIGTASLRSPNPNNFQKPFFVDTTVPNSLKEITTPGAANWWEISSNLE